MRSISILHKLMLITEIPTWIPNIDVIINRIQQHASSLLFTDMWELRTCENLGHVRLRTCLCPKTCENLGHRHVRAIWQAVQIRGGTSRENQERLRIGFTRHGLAKHLNIFRLVWGNMPIGSETIYRVPISRNFYQDFALTEWIAQ